MFREMRRNDRELGTEDINRILNSGEYGFLSTKGGENFPYCLPISYVYLNECIYFHCATEGHKIDNIKEDNRVSFSIVGRTMVLPEKFSTVYESVILFGYADEVHDLEKTTALEALIKKYSPEYLKEGMRYIESAKDRTKVFRISVERVTGKGRKQ